MIREPVIDTEGEAIIISVMTKEEVQERVKLNQIITSEAIRRYVISENGNAPS